MVCAEEMIGTASAGRYRATIESSRPSLPTCSCLFIVCNSARIPPSSLNSASPIRSLIALVLGCLGESDSSSNLGNR